MQWYNIDRKVGIVMELEYIITLVTLLVTLVLGAISKKNPAMSNKLIPIQNLVVGIVVAVIEWIITKNFSTAIALSGLIAGGTYDIIHNLEKILKGE
jgi:di/tricarboxylate transporter